MRGQQRVPGRDGGPVGQAGPATAPDAGSRGPDRPGCRESPAGRDPGDPGRGCPGLSRPPGGYKTAHREDPSGWRETEDNDVVVPRSAHRAGEFPRGSRGRSAADSRASAALAIPPARTEVESLARKYGPEWIDLALMAAELAKRTAPLKGKKPPQAASTCTARSATRTGSPSRPRRPASPAAPDRKYWSMRATSRRCFSAGCSRSRLSSSFAFSMALARTSRHSASAQSGSSRASSGRKVGSGEGPGPATLGFFHRQQTLRALFRASRGNRNASASRKKARDPAPVASRPILQALFHDSTDIAGTFHRSRGHFSCELTDIAGTSDRHREHFRQTSGALSTDIAGTFSPRKSLLPIDFGSFPPL